MGVLTAQIVAARGELVGALMVDPDDEVFAITSSGGVIRTAAAEVKKSGRQTMGVRLMNLAAGDSLVAIARNAESGDADVNGDEAADEPAGEAPEGPGDRDGGEPEATD
jgi:DNA gyrase subunit A